MDWNGKAAIWITVALLLANLPFLSRRMFVFGRVRSSEKTMVWLAFEWLLMYAAALSLSLLLEGASSWTGGAVKGWQFYVISAFLFTTFAAPGFIYRYLYQRKSD
ncbi:DUF2818 family protein [Lampropedia puyangensis]|nr:DUF2818 family protein [Lampropedia puyangensis]